MEEQHFIKMGDLDYAKLASKYLERVYYNLETLCICFPGRISGSENLEKALNYFEEFGVEHFPEGCCQSETVTCVPCWTRGDWKQEICSFTIIPGEGVKPEPYPLHRQIRVLANGLSVGTGPDGISAPLVIVHSWDELTSLGLKGDIRDKLVLFDYLNYVSYGTHAAFRGRGAHEAAKYGAKGVLIRSLTPNSSTSGVHTGSQTPYDTTGSVPSIPAACVSVEDAELFRRLTERGHSIHATLTLPCSQLPDRLSRNIVFEIPGWEFPQEIVIIGGHTDCWDCQHSSCQGAHDDGQGVVIAMEIVRILLETGVKPRRTIRAVLFVDEEVRQSGAEAYARAHAHEAQHIVAAIETDLGVGPVCGFGFSGSAEGRDLLRTLLSPLSSLGDVTNVDDKWSGHGVDISPLIDRFKVPGLLLRHEDSWWNEDYFHIHHTVSDTIDHVDKKLLELNLGVLLGATWILSNCDEKLPR